MRSVSLISVFAIAIGAAAASDCDLLLDQFDAAADACALSCYGEGSVQREGLVEIAEVRHQRSNRRWEIKCNIVLTNLDFRGTLAKTTVQ